MKKIILYLVFVIAAALASAQYNVESGWVDINGSTKHAIVRYWKDKLAVAYYVEGGRGYIALVDIENNTEMRYPLADNYYIRDICVLGADAYFCGCYSEGIEPSDMRYPPIADNKGMLGHFHLPDAGCTPINLDYHTVEGGVNILDRLETYNQAGNVHLVAIGRRYFSTPIGGGGYYTGWKTEIVEGDYYYTMPINLQHISLGASSTGTERERIFDVFETDNYVSFLGFYVNEGNGTAGISIHRCDKGSAVADYNNIPFHCYPTNEELLSVEHNVYLKEDYVAVLSLAHDNVRGYHTRLRVFDLTNMKMVRSQYYLCEKSEVSDATFVDGNGHLIVSHGLEEPSMLIDMHPFATSPYTTWQIKHSGWEFSSLDAAHSTHCIAATGRRWFVKDVMQPVTTQGCYMFSDFHVGIMKNIEPVIIAPPPGDNPIATRFDSLPTNLDSASGSYCTNP